MVEIMIRKHCEAKGIVILEQQELFKLNDQSGN